MKIVFIINLSTFGSKVLLTLKIMNSKNAALTKVVHDFAQFHLETTNDFYLHYDDDMFDVPPCGCQDLFCK
jgi:hypothetical protein